MTGSLPAHAAEWFSRASRSRRMRNILTISLVVLGPVLAMATVFALGAFEGPVAPVPLRFVILVDLLYVLVIAALVAFRIARMIAERRRQSAGSRLHMRLMLVFSVVAMAPTILVAFFATASINFGLETWFSDRVRTVLGTSLAAAQAYENEHRENLKGDLVLLASYLERAKERNPLLAPGDLRELLARGQAQIQRELPEAYVIDGMGDIVVRGSDSYLFDFEKPSEESIGVALGGDIAIIEDWPDSEFRALIRLTGFADRFLYVTRVVDGGILTLLDETKDTVNFYQQLEQERGQLLLEFALIYLGFALIVILAAMWLSLWFADRLASPVGRLAGAAQRVGAGDFEVRVTEEKGDDEIAMLSRIFNRMTEQVKGQRDALVAANLETERRRRLFAAVLSGVTAGVIGLDGDGTVEVMNGAAREMLECDQVQGQSLCDAAPNFGALFERMRAEGRSVIQDQVHVLAGNRGRDFLVRISSRMVDGETEGYVITFDDITDLVSAQRMAAWGDVARRIAHEIKNPLTPIQLSAERLKRKFGKQIETERENFDHYADVIIRQTGDLRRIVDEFSKFARMPAPQTRREDFVSLVRDAVLLQKSGRPDIDFSMALPEAPLYAVVDPTLIGQALTNLIKNAGEAIDTRKEKQGDAPKGRISVRLEEEEGAAVLSIEDNGIGLPATQRARLFEPYVTTREKGTGLGLSIVRKIVEEHSGRLELSDAAADETGHAGALARLRIPVGPLPRESRAGTAA
ncbi:PAS domain-containing sensor histidine kinase [Oceanicella sp. SM1341]|uniref:sensor histidine kinase NtrY-like n=1 Tax=Oceanicella sp. SM1341 TaxID=1548889 RepID=UPI001E2FF98F|nr:PAS domain-containing sensor histidine kinase [Oceanicella sp. SM1341]